MIAALLKLLRVFVALLAHVPSLSSAGSDRRALPAPRFYGRAILVIMLGVGGVGLGNIGIPDIVIQAQPPVTTASVPLPTLPAVIVPVTPSSTLMVSPTPLLTPAFNDSEQPIPPVIEMPPVLSLALDSTLIKALLRARIVLLLQAKAQATQQAEHTLLLPLVMAETQTTTIAESALDAPTPLPVPLPSETPLPAALPTDSTVRTAQVPILMYHYLSVPPDDADIYRRDLSLSPEQFAQHLDRLQAEGYTTLRLDDLLLHLTQGAPLPEKPVLLTFDDGYRDNYTNAFPLLAERGMTATFFIVTDFIDQQRPEYLSWDMVREMYAGGMAIESHGRNHASLEGRDDDYLIWQALGSLETIEYELGVRPRFVSYPAGAYDGNTVHIFQSAHYWAGVTTIQGATHSSEDLFELHRVRVRGTTDADELMRLLTLDW